MPSIPMFSRRNLHEAPAARYHKCCRTVSYPGTNRRPTINQTCHYKKKIKYFLLQIFKPTECLLTEETRNLSEILCHTSKFLNSYNLKNNKNVKKNVEQFKTNKKSYLNIVFNYLKHMCCIFYYLTCFKKIM